MVWFSSIAMVRLPRHTLRHHTCTRDYMPRWGVSQREDEEAPCCLLLAGYGTSGSGTGNRGGSVATLDITSPHAALTRKTESLSDCLT